MTRKTFVLDTSVLIHDSEAMGKFPNSNVVIPFSVLEELDRMKRLPSEAGRNALGAIRYLSDLKHRSKGDWKVGISVDNGSVITLEQDRKIEGAQNFPFDSGQNKAIIAAYNLQSRNSANRVILVSKDTAGRIKAEAVGLKTEDYENLKVSFDKIYKGVHFLDVEKKDIDSYYKDGHYPLSQNTYRANEYCVLRAPGNTEVVGRFNQKNNRLEPLLDIPNIWGVKPRNLEQRCAIDLLLRDDIKLVTLVGQAGTGKTLLALAVALRKVFDDGAYSRILISRPVVPLGRDIGYLPGTKEEKLMSWMQPIYDNLAFLCDSTDDEPNETLRWVTESQKLEMEAVTYIRGRSLPKMFFIIDEAQNLTPHEIKTVISRAGEGTKVVLAGDPTQIDNPYLDRDSNGLSYTIDRLQNNRIFGHMFLEKTERSELAALAAEAL